MSQMRYARSKRNSKSRLLPALQVSLWASLAEQFLNNLLTYKGELDVTP